MDNQTQQDANNLISDIFGDDDDDDIIIPSKRGNNSNNTIDDDLNDSDDDFNTIKSTNKVISNTTITSNKFAVTDIFGSDDDDDDDDGNNNINQFNKTIKKRKTMKRKRVIDKPTDKSLDKSNNKQQTIKPNVNKQPNEESSDEYDSGEDIVKTTEDDAFIDQDDDQKYLLDEYDQDQQNFNDKPDNYIKKTKKKINKSSSNTGSSNDPLSQTLQSLKKPKILPISDADNSKFVTELLDKLSYASKKDDECINSDEPAIHKLKLLDSLKQAIRLKELHFTMLEKDILSRLRLWIEPKVNKNNELILPALEVRTTIYNILNILPCQSDHLKSSGIGITIMQLRKNKLETIENKKILKELIEKWCRPLFGKSTDPTSMKSNILHNEELINAASIQNLSSDIITSSNNNIKVNNLLLGQSSLHTISDPKARVKTPYSNGFVFTVRPDSKTIEKRDINEERLGESRMKIFKLTKVKKGSNKDNFRAIQVDTSGRDKI